MTRRHPARFGPPIGFVVLLFLWCLATPALAQEPTTEGAGVGDEVSEPTVRDAETLSEGEASQPTVGEAGTPNEELPAQALPSAVDECLGQHQKAQEQRFNRQLIEARTNLRSCSQPHCPSMVRADCIAWLEDIEPTVPSIVLAARSDRGYETGVRVLLDGQVLTEVLDDRAVELNPGVHRLRFESPPYLPVTQTILVREGQRNRVVLARLQLPPPPPEQVEPIPLRRRIPVLAYALGGLAIGSVGAGIGLGVAAVRLDRDSEDCAPLCDQSIERAVRQRALAADIAFGTSILAASASGYLILRSVRDPSVRTSRVQHRLRFGCLDSGIGASLEGDIQ